MYPGITERIKIRIPEIDLSELRLCYLKKLDCLKVNQISKLLNIQSQGVSNKWNRLYYKIKTGERLFESIDDFIADI